MDPTGIPEVLSFQEKPMLVHFPTQTDDSGTFSLGILRLILLEFPADTKWSAAVTVGDKVGSL